MVRCLITASVQKVGSSINSTRFTINPTIVINKAIYSNILLIANVKYDLYCTEFMNIILLDYIKNSKLVNALFKRDNLNTGGAYDEISKFFLSKYIYVDFT